MQPVGPLSCAVRSHILSLRRVRKAPSVDASNRTQKKTYTINRTMRTVRQVFELHFKGHTFRPVACSSPNQFCRKTGSFSACLSDSSKPYNVLTTASLNCNFTLPTKSKPSTIACRCWIAALSGGLPSRHKPSPCPAALALGSWVGETQTAERPQTLPLQPHELHVT